MLQVHIEQGPVLEWLGFPFGVVKGIAGQTRLKVNKVLPACISFFFFFLTKTTKIYLYFA
jgi:hypothetical protein